MLYALVIYNHYVAMLELFFLSLGVRSTINSLVYDFSLETNISYAINISDIFLYF